MNNDRLGFLRDKANKLSKNPGVYLMKDKNGKIIYVGKAKALKNRVTTYFTSIETHIPKTYKLVENIYDFDFIVTETELDALVLESSLIKQNNPKYNILLKDTKGYNYIKVSNEPFPKITYSLNTNDKTATYIGPFTSGFTVKQTVEDANKIFMLRSCNKNFPNDFFKERPCLNYHIKRCVGVCRGCITSEEYKNYVDSAVKYMKKGSKESIETLTEEMEKAAEELRFEQAAKLRDQINAIKKANTSQKILTNKTTNYDIIGLAETSELASVAVIKYRGGRLVDKENFFIGDLYEPSQMRSDFIVGYYSKEIPPEIYVDVDLDDKELLEAFFKETFGHKVNIHRPLKGEGLTQIYLAKSNASEYLSMKVGGTSKEINALSDLAKLLGLPKIPTIIESYDISNIGEDIKVGGMVVYRNGRPYKAGYRKFTIKEVNGLDDYACMEEVIRRRFNRYLASDEGFNVLPDLILLDGGKGHITVVQKVLDEMHIDVSLFGLVKDDKHRTRAIAKSGGEIQITSTKSVFNFVTNIQDEVHRFSIAFSRKSHSNRTFDLELTKIPGIGQAKATALLKTFKTKAGLRDASAEELAKVAKVTIAKAEEIKERLQE